MLIIPLNKISDLLYSITPNTYHYYAKDALDKYIVWAEDDESGAAYSDDKKTDQIIQGTIDYFTKDEYDPVVREIQNKLTENEISWKLNSVQYEKDTGYIHHEWVWEVDDGEL